MDKLETSRLAPSDVNGHVNDKANHRFQVDIGSYWSRWARVWDPLLHLARLNRRYREEGVSVLNLQKGQTVLDVACGTGLNFPCLLDAVGPGGRIIAIDIAQGMLERAKERVRKNGWHNFEFVLGDVSQTALPRVDVAAAFWCMISIPDYQKTLTNVVSALSPGGELAVLDFKRIDGFSGTLANPIFELVCRVTHQDVNREPWADMEQLLNDVQMREWRFGGLLLSNVYLAWGTKR